MTLAKYTSEEEIEKIIQEIYFSTSPEREFVIYAPPEFWDAVNIAIEEEFKKLIQNDISTNTHV